MLSLFRRGKTANDESDDSNKKKLKKGESKASSKKKDDDEQEEERKKFVNVRYRQWMKDAIHGIPLPRTNKFETPERYPPSCLCLPPAVIECCPWLMEENVVCTTVGRVGLCSPDEPWARNAVMRYALVLNQICMLLGIFACLSITDSNYDLLQYASVAKAELKPTPANFFSVITLNVGLQAVTIDNPNTGLQEVVRFDQFCANVGNGIEKFIQDPADQTCKKCDDVRLQTVIGLIVAVVCILPSMVLNCSRMYRPSDLNCTKVYAAFVQCLSLAGFVLTYYQFTFSCIGDVFFDENVSYARSGEITETDSINEAVQVEFDWSVGYGMICLYAAFGLKFVDFICNCCMPTPAITRNTYEQKIYEVKVQELLEGKINLEGGIQRDDSFSDEGDNASEGS